MLPGLDDGARNWDESLAMARTAATDGFSTVVVTPHQLGSYRENRGETIRAKTRQLQGLLDEQGVPLTVLPGADVRIEPDMIGKIRSGQVVTLADRGRYVLLELPHEVYVPLDRLLEELDAAGLVGILSHPERNHGILRQPHVVSGLVKSGCLMQVTAGSVVGTFGPHVEKCAEWLLGQGFVHFLATDAHGAKSRRPLMNRAFDRVGKLVGYRSACEMCCENPARVVTGGEVPRGRRRPKALSLGSWLRWRKAG